MSAQGHLCFDLGPAADGQTPPHTDLHRRAVWGVETGQDDEQKNETERGVRRAVGKRGGEREGARACGGVRTADLH